MRLCVGAAGVISLATATELSAQRGLNRACTAPVTVILAFPTKAPDAATAKEVREKLVSTFKDFGSGFCVLGVASVNEMLASSSFPVDAPISTRDAVTLGGALRADEIIEFAVVPVGKSYQINARSVLTSNKQGLLNDSIPKHEAGDMISLVAKNFLYEYKNVLKSHENSRKCDAMAREQKFAEAEAAGRQALKDLPTSNVARICLATVLRAQKKNAEEVLSLTEAVLKTDPDNMLALENALNTAFDKGDQATYATVGTRIISIDPAYPFAENIIGQLVQWKKTDEAIRLLSQSLAGDPDNVNLRRIQFRLIYAAEKWKDAQKAGESLAKDDTASVDTAFVNRMVSAYVQDSNPQKAAEWLSRGTSKWPQDMKLAMALAQMFKNLGQTDQAIAEYQRVIKVNPEGARGIRVYIADAYSKAGKPDSALAWARRAAEAGDDKAQAAAIITAIGIARINAAQKSNSVDDWKGAISVLAAADSLNPADRSAGFYWGVAAFSTGYQLYKNMTENGAKPTCEGLKEVKEYLLLSNDKVRAGASTNQTVAANILTNFGTMLGAADQAATTLKCAGS